MGLIVKLSRYFVILFLPLFMGCGKAKSNFDYKIALDPSWYSLALPGQESNLTAFTCELLEALSKIERISIGIYQKSWNNLVWDLQEGEYDAICTTMQPYIFYEKLYTFSDLYLMTGPVLVTSIKSPYTSLSQFSDLELGIQEGSNGAVLLEKYPRIIQRTYNSIPAALLDLQKGAIQGALIDILAAKAYTQDLFQGQLKISSPILVQEGIRLVGLKPSSEKLMQIFNRGLIRLKKNGTYTILAKKWNLSE